MERRWWPCVPNRPRRDEAAQRVAVQSVGWPQTPGRLLHDLADTVLGASWQEYARPRPFFSTSSSDHGRGFVEAFADVARPIRGSCSDKGPRSNPNAGTAGSQLQARGRASHLQAGRDPTTRPCRLVGRPGICCLVGRPGVKDRRKTFTPPRIDPSKMPLLASPGDLIRNGMPPNRTGQQRKSRLREALHARKPPRRRERGGKSQPHTRFARFFSIIAAPRRDEPLTGFLGRTGEGHACASHQADGGDAHACGGRVASSAPICLRTFFLSFFQCPRTDHCLLANGSQ